MFLTKCHVLCNTLTLILFAYIGAARENTKSKENCQSVTNYNDKLRYTSSVSRSHQVIQTKECVG